jgi:hypothetical protein
LRPANDGRLVRIAGPQKTGLCRARSPIVHDGPSSQKQEAECFSFVSGKALCNEASRRDWLAWEKIMKRESFAKGSIVCGLALAAVIAGPTRAADKIPDIKGKWVGKTHSIIAGMAPHWPSNMGTFEKPGLFEKDLEIDITGQDGNRFWGNQIFTGNGDQKTEERMIGELTGANYRTLVLVDTDGYLIGNDTISFCYTQAGGKTESSVVSCTQIKRVR